MSVSKLFIALRSALFFSFLSIIAWVTGEPFIFPSLGPTAYVLGFRPQTNFTAKTVIGGHACGAVAGLVSYNLLVAPYQLNMLTEPLSHSGFMLVLGAILAVFLTVLLMLIFEASHPPACATTLIISLGILSSLYQAVLIISAVVIIYLAYRLYVGFQKSYFPSKDESSNHEHK